MKIGEARETYWDYCYKLKDQQTRLAQKLSSGTLSDEERGVILELSDQVSKKYDEVNHFVRFDLIQYTVDKENALLAPEQAKAARKYAEDIVKIMEIARRISNGDHVPASDEKRLMDYDSGMYMAAKQAATLNAMKKHEDYDSLWDDEEEDDWTSMEEAEEKVNGMEMEISAPAMDVDTGADLDTAAVAE